MVGKNGAISKENIVEISEIKEFRNAVAHQIDKILGDSDYSFDSNEEKRMFELIKQIEIWWIKEVEIPCNPEFDDKEIKDEEIIAGKEFFYTYIKNITDQLITNEKKRLIVIFT